MAYDWLFPLLTPSQKQQFAETLINRTLTQTQQNHDQGLYV